MAVTIWVSCFPQPHGTPGLDTASSQRIYKIPYDRVWDATLAVVLEDLEFPLDLVERTTGLITTEWVTYERKPGSYREAEMISVNSPTRPMFVSYRVMIMVKITPEGTMVRVRRYSREYIDRWTPVATDLQFERQFLLMIDRRLGVNP